MPLTASDRRNRSLGRRVHDNEMVATLHELLQRLDGIAANRHALDLEGELLLGEAPGRIVVRERDLRAGDADILRLDLQPRQRNDFLHLLLEIADRHRGRRRRRLLLRRLALRWRLGETSRRCRQQSSSSKASWPAHLHSETMTHALIILGHAYAGIRCKFTRLFAGKTARHAAISGKCLAEWSPRLDSCHALD